jgi:hypothetical protein
MDSNLIPSHARSLPRWLKWGVPALIFIYPAFLIVPSLNWEANLYREYGLIETLSNLFLLTAFILAVKAIFMASTPLQRGWSILFTLFCILFFGEEISWGQHYVKWTTPETWTEINSQNETNLHNLKGWPEYIFTEVSRNLLSTAMVLGAIIVPWWLRRNPRLCKPDSPNFWLWPSSQSGPLAVLAVVCNIPKRFLHNFDIEVPWRYYGVDDGELKECLFALFILLYAIVLLKTLRSLKRG